MISISRPGEWDHLMPSVAGAVRSLATAFVSVERREVGLMEIGRTATCVLKCPDCGGLRWVTSGGPHAPRWLNVGGRHVKVDCVGRAVSPAESGGGASTPRP